MSLKCSLLYVKCEEEFDEIMRVQSVEAKKKLTFRFVTTTDIANGIFKKFDSALSALNVQASCQGYSTLSQWAKLVSRHSSNVAVNWLGTYRYQAAVMEYSSAAFVSTCTRNF